MHYLFSIEFKIIISKEIATYFYELFLANHLYALSCAKYCDNDNDSASQYSKDDIRHKAQFTLHTEYCLLAAYCNKKSWNYSSF